MKDVYDTDDLVGSGVSQMWCMYKEVAGYYQNGVSPYFCPVISLEPNLATVKLEVPDDGMFLLRHPVQKYLKNSQCFVVTVLFADDNYGNIMSVLPPEREGHKAGAGIYYHVDCECFCLLACIAQH